MSTDRFRTFHTLRSMFDAANLLYDFVVNISTDYGRSEMPEGLDSFGVKLELIGKKLDGETPDDIENLDMINELNGMVRNILVYELLYRDEE